MKKGWLVFIALVLALGPVLVPPKASAAGVAFTSVSSQNDTSLALDNEGSIWAWGSNYQGEFGNGTVTGSAWPQRIEVLDQGQPVTFRDVRTGFDHSVALDSDGKIWTTGHNGRGQLGQGHFNGSLSWTKLAITDEGAAVSFSMIAAGWGSSYAIDDHGEPWGWGLRISSTMPYSVSTPTKLGLTDGGSPVALKSIAVNSEQAIGIDTYNHLWQVALVGGQTQQFNLSDGGTTPQFQSVAVGAGYGNSGFLALALETDGDLWVWGSNDHGQLGGGGANEVTRWSPEKLTVMDGGSPVAFARVAGGNHHALALDTNGNLWAWGKNDQGQLGNGTTAGAGPVKVAATDNGNLVPFTSITAGYERSYALDAEGRIWAWGYPHGLMPSRFPAGISPTVSLGVSQPSSTYLEDITLTAAVSGEWGTPTGTIEFRDGANVLGTRTLSGGTAELNLSTLFAGPHDLSVYYGGDAAYAAEASASLTYTVHMPAAPALTLTPSTTADTYDPLTVSVDVQIDGAGNALASLKWLAGSHGAAAFAGAGADILAEGSFEAASSGFYTVYARDAAGSETVETIELTNILVAGDAAGLLSAIADAEQALADHPEGTGVGEVPAAARGVLQAALEAAQAVADAATHRTQEQLDSARSSLETATAAFRDAVIGAGDAAGLLSAIADAEQALADHPEGTGVGEAPSAARGALQAALEAAQAVADAAAHRTQEQLDSARSSLETATAAFRAAVIGAGDAAGLLSAIADAEQALADHPEGTGVGEVPAAARGALQAALEAAQAVADEAAHRTQERLDSARSALETATAAFRAAVIGAGDAAGLLSAIADAEQALADHPEGTGVGEVPAAARGALQAALEAAQAVADEAAHRTQERLDSARSALEAATAAFRVAVVGLALTAPNDGLYGTGSSLEFVLTYRDAVTVTGTPRLGIQLGIGSESETVYAGYTGSSGESGTALRFTYEVAAGLSALEGIRLDAELSLPDGASIVYSGSAENALTVYTVRDTSRVRIASVAPAIELSAGGGAGRTAEITVTASAHGSEAGNTLAHLRWLAGSLTAADFDGGASGADILEPRTFTVSENRDYTVYAKDAAGNEAVHAITISSIARPVYPQPIYLPPVEPEDEPEEIEEPQAQQIYELQLTAAGESLALQWTQEDLTALLHELDGRSLAAGADAGWTLMLPKETASALNPDSMLQVRTSLGDYLLPTALLRELDDQPYSEVRVTLSPASDSERRTLQEAAAALGAEVHGQSLQVSISVVTEGIERTLDDFGHDVTLTTPRLAMFDGGQQFVARYEPVQGGFSFVPAALGERDWTWRARSGGLYAVLTYDKQFADMQGSWASEAVHRLASLLIVKGVDGENFVPKASVTRAELTAMIVRALGLPTVAAGQAAFDDVDSSSWYADSLAVAAHEGIVQGDAGGGFRPDASITRQEAAALLLRAQQWAGIAPAAGGEDVLNGFADSDRIAPWARGILADAVSGGLLQGDLGGRLLPQADISRAEAAVMLARLLGQTTAFQTRTE